MGLRDKILSNVFSSWANLLVNLIISFFLAPFIVNQLGSAYYGIWVIMMQFTGYLYLLDFGVRESIIRYVSKFEVSRKSEELNEILNSAFLLYSGFGAIGVAAALFMALIFPYVFQVKDAEIFAAQFVAITSGLTITITLVFNVHTGILMGLKRFDIINKVGIIQSFVRLALIVVFLNLGYGLVALASIQLLMAVGNNITIYLFAKSQLRKHGLVFDVNYKPINERLPIIKEIFNYSKYVLINNLGQKLIYYTDGIIIGAMISTSAVTFYAIAGNLIDYLHRLIRLTTSVFNPVVTELESRDQASKIGDMLIQGSRFTLLISLPICFTYIFMGREFIGLWMGQEFMDVSGDVLFILAITVLLSIPQNTISSVLYGINKHHMIAKLRVAEAIANLGLSLALIHYIGIIGVALGTAIPQFILMTLILPILVSREVEFSFREYLISVYILPLIAGIPYVMALLFAKNQINIDSLLGFFGVVTLSLMVYLVSVIIICLSARERTEYFFLAKNTIFKKLSR